MGEVNDVSLARRQLKEYKKRQTSYEIRARPASLEEQYRGIAKGASINNINPKNREGAYKKILFGLFSSYVASKNLPTI